MPPIEAAMVLFMGILPIRPARARADPARLGLLPAPRTTHQQGSAGNEHNRRHQGWDRHGLALGGLYLDGAQVGLVLVTDVRDSSVEESDEAQRDEDDADRLSHVASWVGRAVRR